MTDKQIIKLNELTEISQELGLYEQCPYMGDNKICKANLNEVFWWKCYEFDNCLYKKYKAKEQECERLKEEIKTNGFGCFNIEMSNQLKQTEERIVELNKTIKAKEQECEELNADNIYLRDRVGKLERAILRRNDKIDQFKAENEKLKEEKQGLIKDWEEKKNLGYEIACKNEKLKQTLEEIKELCQKHIKAEKIVMANDILQKISEVEDVENN